jgi:hypothetical protein
VKEVKVDIDDDPAIAYANLADSPACGKFIQEVKVDIYGNKEYYWNGQLHREDGPAVEYINGTKKWYRHGQLHREDSPAIEWGGGHKHWYLQGKQYAEEEYWRLVKLKTLW